MLVLTLKEGDYLLIGDDIKVYFEHKISRNTLDVAIIAPKNILILRGKIRERALAKAKGGA